MRRITVVLTIIKTIMINSYKSNTSIYTYIYIHVHQNLIKLPSGTGLPAAVPTLGEITGCVKM